MRLDAACQINAFLQKDWQALTSSSMRVPCNNSLRWERLVGSRTWNTRKPLQPRNVVVTTDTGQPLRGRHTCFCCASATFQVVFKGKVKQRSPVQQSRLVFV